MKTALLIIDIQNDYFEDGRYPLVGSEKASIKARTIIDHFRKTDQLVVFMQHISKREKPNLFEEGTKGVNIHENVLPLANEKVIIKHYPNSFKQTELLDYLKQHNIEQLAVCGMMTHLCIDATVRAAKDHDFKCIVIADTCATRDIELYDSIIEAAHIQVSFLAALGSYYAKILTVEDFIKIL